MKILCADWLHMGKLLRYDHKMAASRFFKVTDEEINCFKENAYFSNNHQCNYSETIIHLRLREYR